MLKAIGDSLLQTIVIFGILLSLLFLIVTLPGTALNLTAIAVDRLRVLWWSILLSMLGFNLIKRGP
jgi:hypothetical protein